MFLKPIMLAGVGAAVIPLVLHLLNKARYRTVEWGAMMFLDAPPARHQASTRIRQAVILMIRMSMIALLAIALARPVIRGGKATANEDARVHAIIILDRSASMSIEDAGRTRMATAKQAVINILSNLNRGDEVSLILSGDPVDPGQAQPTSDLQSVATRVSQLGVSFDRANFAAAIEQAQQAISREPNVTHEIYLVCDRQANGWESINDKFAAGWRDVCAKVQSPLRLFVLPVGGEESDNVAVESIRVPGPPVIRDMPAQVEVRLKNFGAVPRSNLPLAIYESGKQIGQTVINLAPDSSGTATARVRFTTSGSQVLSARLSTSGMRVDDHIDSAIDVLEPVRVLVITGEDRESEKQRSADFVKLALAPFAAANQKGIDPAVVRIIGVDDWWGISPDRDDVIVLTNFGALADDQIRQIEQFVYGGGGLIVAPGNLTDIESCNNDLYRDGEGFLPASFKSIANSATRVQQLDLSHPIFSFLRNNRLAAMQDVPVAKCIALEDRGPDSRVLATLANGQPLLIERSYGRGRVLLFSSTLGAEWNRLPATTLYLPAMQSAVRYLAGAALAPRNLRLGEPIELTFDHQPADLFATIALPNGVQQRVQAVQSGTRWAFRFSETNQPGRYIVTMRGSAMLNYVVAAPRDESDPLPLSAQRWDYLQKSLNFRRVEPQRDSIAAAIASERTGRELHVPLIACVVLLALGEMCLARLWSR
jgi:hypothetical protein